MKHHSLRSISKIVMLVYLVLAGGNMLIAQSNNITGIVKDARTGEVLPGVSILVKDSPRGTITDVNGKYTVQAPQGAILVFSFIGYEKTEITVAGSTRIDVSLNESVSQLEESSSGWIWHHYQEGGHRCSNITQGKRF
jgi:uncharacterized protein YbaA (DUF1428 family)